MTAGSGAINVVGDVEADGPCAGKFSMVSLGMVLVEPGLRHTFKAKFAPISDLWIPEALAISGVTREQHESYPPATEGSLALYFWLQGLRKDNPGRKITFWSDNPAFDWGFINYYLMVYGNSGSYDKRNPMGHSARRIGDLYAGYMRDIGASSKWKKLRDTKHTHDPIDDATGNAEALLKIMKMLPERAM